MLQALFHALTSHSSAVYDCALRFDYLGIVLSITGTNVSFVWCGMYDRESWMGVYASVSLICAGFVLNAIAMAPTKYGVELEVQKGAGVKAR